ncbi:unnamed protein product [Adineta ricciae]|uniref:Uncharacterized protein n=1 Tax=Adineta ricciae TaxID=249248 RepID=A0A815GA48_ADIRI|nr:unnamed protein product [Adineta ricciae]
MNISSSRDSSDRKRTNCSTSNKSPLLSLSPFGQPISTPSRCSRSSSDLPLNHVLQEKSDNSSLSSPSNKHHDPLSYLIERN